MPRCLRKGEAGQAAHTGDWLFCPWCGDRLPPPRTRPQRREAGRCHRCGEAAKDPTDAWCAPCWMAQVARHYANGHTTEEIAALRADGRSWREVAVACGLTRPRKGPKDVHDAALWAWIEAGRPGDPGDPPSKPPRADYGAYLAWRRSLEMASWQRARDAAMDRWLAEVADAR